MRRECIKQGIAPERVHPFAGPTRVEQVGEPVPSTTPRFKERRLIFAGRMDFVKGPSFLLDAIPSVASQIRDPIVVVLAGDGPETARLERKEKALTRRCQQVRIEFTGWLGQAELNHQLARADLLIVPSLWPEPYGLIGPQAARFGLPTVAYGSGAIPEWLFDGINGVLVSATPPTAPELADAIIRVLGDDGLHARLRRGAVEHFNAGSMDAHVAQLSRIFEAVSVNRV